ncbi:MAG TPA: Asp-tRNA(Asn)/Glu-tRNA(Gln) amidotransferase subunit GatA [Fimbriimonadaceae bacterium]|nr:Asp-tRNA(Asn)/Glu-tRNA(Gln) amidotransferase subunit GatA [Fimbriimonadaceae bacterium]HRJ33852.1 Asp-tRNA(Asn)/Glu-tRNA(Gln) amidotransferase subunit GatA [Fimbriimonadaceae bacterium]
MSQPLFAQSAADLARRLRAREVSATEVAEAHLDRVSATDPQVGAFLTMPRDEVMADAAAAQAMLDRGEGGPLCGVPVGIKDNISTRGVATTCASKLLENYVPPFDATVIEKLRAQGIVCFGKTNLDEFAMGTSCENSAFQLTRNPWDLDRTPGGSSGGSAACVAAQQVPLSLGSDTGGSIRLPAALCGLVGFKPTYGRVSRYGLIAFGSSLDQIGPFGRTVEDVALLSEAISGYDHLDSTSLDRHPIQTNALKSGSLRGLKLAIPDQLMTDEIQPGVRATFESALDLLRKEGVEITPVSLPSIQYGVTTYYIIAPAEASSNLARFDGIRYGLRLEGEGHIGNVATTRGEGFGHEVKARIMIGTYVLSAGYYDAYYTRAQQVRALMVQEFESTYRDFDAVISPTSPSVAFRLGELKDNPMAMKLLDFCTIPANMGGFPSISIPAGLSDHLPVGLQLTGPIGDDERILQLAYALEQALPPTPSPAMG